MKLAKLSISETVYSLRERGERLFSLIVFMPYGQLNLLLFSGYQHGVRFFKSAKMPYGQLNNVFSNEHFVKV